MRKTMFRPSTAVLDQPQPALAGIAQSTVTAPPPPTTTSTTAAVELAATSQALLPPGVSSSSVVTQNTLPPPPFPSLPIGAIVSDTADEGGEEKEKAARAFVATELKLDQTQSSCVVFNTQLPLTILAGAGSGKTQTIAGRIAYLVLSGVAPEKILALSFTRFSCMELRDRIQAIISKATTTTVSAGNDGAHRPIPVVLPRTLHSFGLWVLRTYLDERVNVIDHREQRKIARLIVESSDVIRSTAGHHGILELVNNLLRYVNEMKEKGKRPGPIVEPSPDSARNNPILYLAYLYEKHLRDHDLVDFGDLQIRLMEALRVLPKAGEEEEEGATLAQKLRRRFTHIIVDEFQDLNEVQFNIVCSLCGDACRITAVGDPNQAIYEWRGAMPDIFRKFSQRFNPSSKEAFVSEKALGVNYRSVPRIVAAGNAIALKKVDQTAYRQATNAKIHHVVTAGGPLDLEDLLIQIVRSKAPAPPSPSSTTHSAAAAAADSSLPPPPSSYAFGDICILVRSGARGLTVRKALARGKIPFRYLRRTDATVRDEMKKLMAALRLATDPDGDDELALRGLDLLIKQAANLMRFKAALWAERRRRHRASSSSSKLSVLQFLEYLLTLTQKRPSSSCVTSFASFTSTDDSSSSAPQDLSKILPNAKVDLRKFVHIVRGVAAMLADDEKTMEDIFDFACAEFDHEDQQKASGQRKKRGRVDGVADGPDDEEEAGVMAARPRQEDNDDDDDEVADAVTGSVRNFLAEALGIVNLSSSMSSSLAMISPSRQHEKQLKLHHVLDDMLNLTGTDDYGRHSGVTAAGGSRSASSSIHNRVVVSTVHGAKGLEWPVVIIYECNMGHFPPGPPKEARSQEARHNIKREEHRVFYVAVTRARDELFLLSHREDDVSPFVEEIPSELVSYELHHAQ